ncbi:hypothetical protein [Paracoccus broussonetiae]|uniref:hypothetical protein n=1 Tax=Paracoccus broussonetiae TaxID=3075834 RepID=UPI00288B61A1|nr:hypothetical protein [Paracoccus sp. CPCC 101403]
MEVELSGVLAIGVAIAAICTIGGTVVLGLSFWSALLLYSLSGTAATLFVAWRRFRCAELNEKRVSHG